jgi:pimeloyl-ACP methyl ester carboxylesterase
MSNSSTVRVRKLVVWFVGALLVSILSVATTSPVSARVQPFPPEFKVQTISTNGAKIYVRVGGKGPAVVLLHGYGETGDMWAPLAVVPDLRGMGLSSRPPGGYDKKTQGEDIAGLLDALKIGNAGLVTHDIGNMVGYAFAALHPDRVTKFVLIDAPLPGVGPWEDIVRSHALWHCADASNKHLVNPSHWRREREIFSSPSSHETARYEENEDSRLEKEGLKVPPLEIADPQRRARNCKKIVPVRNLFHLQRTELAQRGDGASHERWSNTISRPHKIRSR